MPRRAANILGILLALAWTTSARGDATPPHILLILVDDLGYGDLSCYGAPDLRSPAVDALAARGLRFTRFYANSCVCSPTRAALLTGRRPDEVGVPGVIRTHPPNSWGWLSPGARTLPERLAEAGYDTAMIGKWHLGLESPNTPTERGFAHFRGFLGDMMDDYYHHRRHGQNYMRHGDETIDPEGHATDLFTDWSIEYLRSRAEDETPFFLYLAYNAPHTPIQPPEDHLARVRERHPDMSERRARLVALIEHLDEGIGRVLDALESTGLADDTLVVFSSDNGGQLGVGARNGPLRDGKGSMYEGGLRVPTVAAWPGRIAPGGESSRIAMTMDIYPTLLAAAGVDAPAGLDGVSFLDALDEPGAAAPDRDIFFVRREGGRQFGGLSIFGVRRGDWKLVRNSPWSAMELFDLASDPLEERDRSSDEPRVLRELEAALRAQIQRGGRVPWQSP